MEVVETVNRDRLAYVNGSSLRMVKKKRGQVKRTFCENPI